MRTYIGTKVITAEPEQRDGVAGYKVVYPDGYESWSPKDVFEEAYQRVDAASAENLRFEIQLLIANRAGEPKEMTLD